MRKFVEESDSDQTTRTLRTVGGAAPLTLLPGAAFPVLVSSVTRGSTALPSEVGNDELSVTFVADKTARTDYRARLQDFLGSRSEALLETRARGPLFDWSLYEDTVSLASLTRNYASIAGKELPELDAGSSTSSTNDDSYDGDTCTGAAAPRAQPAENPQASLATGSRSHAHRPRRTKTSLWTMTLAAVVLPIRRRKRAQTACG